MRVLRLHGSYMKVHLRSAVGAMALIVLVASNFVVAERKATEARTEVTNDALWNYADRFDQAEEFSFDSPEVDRILDSTAGIWRQTMRDAFGAAAIILCPLMALVTFLCFFEAAAAVALLVFSIYFLLFASGLSGWIGLSACGLSFAVMVVCVRARRGEL